MELTRHMKGKRTRDESEFWWTLSGLPSGHEAQIIQMNPKGKFEIRRRVEPSGDWDWEGDYPTVDAAQEAVEKGYTTESATDSL